MSTDAPLTTARISADPDLPVVRIERDFHASPQQVLRAHTDPELFARWIGPHDLTTRITEIRSRTLKFAYEVHRIDPDGTRELLATGETHHIATDHQYRPSRMPDDVLALLAGEG